MWSVTVGVGASGLCKLESGREGEREREREESGMECVS